MGRMKPAAAAAACGIIPAAIPVMPEMPAAVPIPIPVAVAVLEEGKPIGPSPASEATPVAVAAMAVVPLLLEAPPPPGARPEAACS